MQVAQLEVRAPQCFCQTRHADGQGRDEAKLRPGSRTCAIQALFCTKGVCLWGPPCSGEPWLMADPGLEKEEGGELGL